MNIAFTYMAENLGMSFHNVITLILSLAFFLFYVKDFKLGLLMHMFLFGSLFVWFHEAGYNWQIVLILMMMCVVILSLTLYVQSKVSRDPLGGVV